MLRTALTFGGGLPSMSGCAIYRRNFIRSLPSTMTQCALLSTSFSQEVDWKARASARGLPGWASVRCQQLNFRFLHIDT